MSIVCMAIATISAFIFIILYLSAGDDIAKVLIATRLGDLRDDMDTYKIRLELLSEDMKRHHEENDSGKQKQGKDLIRKYNEARKSYDQLKKGKISALDIVPVSGYRLMQIISWNSTNPIVMREIKQCLQYKEKKQGINHAYYVLANFWGFLLLSIPFAFALMTLALYLNLGARAILVGVVLLIIGILLGYSPMNEVSMTVGQRKEDIEKEFPQVISQLTLLVEAGMEVNQAWELTSVSGTGVLYEEMNRVNVALSNNVNPSAAFVSFIQRCSTNYTSKLGTLITQNISKGNSEITKQFMDLNQECWNDFRNHIAKYTEAVQAKLFVPTIMMFVGILIMLIVPIMSSFG